MLDYNDLSFPKLCCIISNQRSGYLVIKLRYNPTLLCDCPVKYYAKILLCSLVNMVDMIQNMTQITIPRLDNGGHVCRYPDI